MKTIKFILLCLSLTTAVASAKDFHLVETPILDNDSKGHPVVSLIYVLVPSDGGRPVAFKTFDSDAMEATIRYLVGKGVLYYDGGALHSLGEKIPTNTQLQALQAFCKNNGIDFVNVTPIH